MSLRSIRMPFLIFMGDETRAPFGKTGLGVVEWARENCIGQLRLSPETMDLRLPDLSPAQARQAGAGSLLIGVAPIGGALPSAWIPVLIEAMEAGLDIVSGLHQRLSAIPDIAAAAQRLGRVLHDVRHSDMPMPVATGAKRSGKRLLTVGTDCALGKKYTALAITRALQRRGVSADFRATGQTGVMISGGGIAIDAVISDFVAGAAEMLSPAAAADHWDVIEGQGAILHPAYAGVTLGLLHGSQPDALVLCHDPTRKEINGYPGFVIAPLATTMDLYVQLARVTNPAARFVGISLNTSALDQEIAEDLAAALEREHGLPCFDPLRFGLESAIERMMLAP